MRQTKARGRKWIGLPQQNGRTLATIKKTEKISWRRNFNGYKHVKEVLSIEQVRDLRYNYLRKLNKFKTDIRSC
jgi:hypothetical protein